jgi:aspartate racemase
MSHKTVGLIGGVGPGSTAAFYQSVVGRYAQRHGGDQPALLIHSVPMTAAIEDAILGGQTDGPEVAELIGMLADGVAALARGGAQAIVMPCNTLQGWLPPLVDRAGLPYIHLVGETAKQIQRAGYQRVALICTAAMRSLGLYQAELSARGLTVVLPTDAEQAGINQAIHNSLHAGSDGAGANAPLLPVLRRLERDADSLLLGCSDLQGLTQPGFTRLPVVDAMDVLAEATVTYLLQ